MSWSSRVRSLRARHRWSLAQAADALGTVKATIANIEHARVKTPHRSLQRAICDAERESAKLPGSTAAIQYRRRFVDGLYECWASITHEGHMIACAAGVGRTLELAEWSAKRELLRGFGQ